MLKKSLYLKLLSQSYYKTSTCSAIPRVKCYHGFLGFKDIVGDTMFNAIGTITARKIAQKETIKIHSVKKSCIDRVRLKTSQ